MAHLSSDKSSQSLVINTQRLMWLSLSLLNSGFSNLPPVLQVCDSASAVIDYEFQIGKCGCATAVLFEYIWLLISAMRTECSAANTRERMVGHDQFLQGKEMKSSNIVFFVEAVRMLPKLCLLLMAYSTITLKGSSYWCQKRLYFRLYRILPYKF